MKNYLRSNIDYLCRSLEGAVKAGGDINVTRAARTIRLGQTTLMRILDGSVEHLRPDTEATIKTYFRLVGEDLIHSDLKQVLGASKVDRIDALIKELTPEEVLELTKRMPKAKIVLE